MRSRVFIVLLLILATQNISLTLEYSQNQRHINLQSIDDYVTTVFYDSASPFNESQALNYLIDGVPVVFYGNDSFNIYELYKPIFAIDNHTITDNRLVVSGLWLQKEEGTIIEHQIQIYDSSFTQEDENSIYKWIDTIRPETTPEGYVIEGLITQINHHEPYGKLETETDILRILDDNSEYDWYDISVSQHLTPGINYTSSSWEWSWLQYTMNGSLGSSNVYLSDYDPPPRNEVPEGPFGFLWKILGFDIRDLIPWLSPPKLQVVGVDMSDFSIELFKARYESPTGFKDKDKPLKIRHHYVLRTDEGIAPRFWHQTQAQYTQSGTFVQIPFITPPLTSGYMTKQK